jgi:hypothetical protein
VGGDFCVFGLLCENMQQYQQIVELEFETKKLKDQMVMMAIDGGFCLWRVLATN